MTDGARRQEILDINDSQSQGQANVVERAVVAEGRQPAVDEDPAARIRGDGPVRIDIEHVVRAGSESQPTREPPGEREIGDPLRAVSLVVRRRGGNTGDGTI